MFNRSRRVIGIPGSRIWTKTLMGLIFNPYGVFRWSPEGPVSQIHSPHLHAGAPGILSDLLRSVHTLKREGVAENNRKLQHLFIPSKTATWVFFGRPAFGQNCNLGVWVCSERSALGQNTLIMISINNFSLYCIFQGFCYTYVIFMCVCVCVCVCLGVCLCVCVCVCVCV